MLAAENLLIPSLVYSQREALGREQESPRHKYRTSLRSVLNYIHTSKLNTEQSTWSQSARKSCTALLKDVNAHHHSEHSD